MTLKLFQNLVYQIKEVIEPEFGIMDESGMIIACSDEKKAGKSSLDISKVVQSKEQFVVLRGITYQKIYIKNKLEFIVYIQSDNKHSAGYLSLISINVTNLKSYYDEKFDKISFLKNVIMDNVLPGDISMRAKELHLSNNVYRVVFLIKTDKVGEVYVHEVIQGLFPNRAKDFIVVLDDENIVLIKELKAHEDYTETEKIARIIVDTLNTELIVRAFVGIGTIVDNIRDIGRSFKEAQMALLVGGVFESDKYIINYNNLGIGRLIYQLPTTLCKLFLKEVFKEGSFESLDSETMLTVQKFFEFNLNVSETSRQLFVHRNTLVYRLDKIQKMTGLDLREFDDAIIFKVAMLVKRYLDKGEKIL